MKNNFAVAVLSLLLGIGFNAQPGLAGIESILGKWLAKAETPNGPIEMEFELRQEGSQLVGTAAMMQGIIPLSAIKFEEPNLTLELSLGGSSYKLLATLKDGKFSGTWEQVGGDMKGTWSAERKVGAVPTAAALPAAAPIAGTWNTISVTPNGEFASTLDLKQEGEAISGTLGSDMGTVPIQAASFKENKLQFDVDLGGTVYRVEGTLKDNKIEGKWYPAAGGEGGSWSATHRATGPAPTVTPPPAAASGAIEGTWDTVAVTPDGNLTFQTVFKRVGDTLSGQIITSDGTLPLKKLSFADNKLSFEVDYMGGTYRIEGVLVDGKLSGKWSAVSGTDTGAWSAGRKL
jgi:hypothetical protein